MFAEFLVQQSHLFISVHLKVPGSWLILVLMRRKGESLNPISRILLVVVGTLCVALGILGALLPLLPATPFLLLASVCYLRSSETLYGKLMNNRYLGPYITNFRERRGMPLKAKVFTLGLLWASLSFSMYRLNSALITLALVATGIITTTIITKMKTLRD